MYHFLFDIYDSRGRALLRAKKHVNFQGDGADMLSGVKVKSVTVHGNSATVVLVNQNGARIGTQPMKKVDGNWYLANLPGDRDSD